MIKNQKITNLLLSVSLLVVAIPSLAQTFPPWGIIHNSTVTPEQTIALGVNQAGNLNTPVGSGTNANNAKTLNSNTPSNPGGAGTATGAVGIAYKWGGYTKVNQSDPKSYPPGWYDGTSPGVMWEGWGVSAVDDLNKPAYGYASLGSQQVASPPVGVPTRITLPNVTNVTVKSFVVDSTSIKSTVWINDNSGKPMLEVTHLYGPTSGLTNKNLFQSLVTITNISGATLRDVRYRRTMDWDVLNNTGSIYSDHVGVSESKTSKFLPRVLNACDNGGSYAPGTPGNNTGLPDPINSNGTDLYPAQPPNPLDPCRSVNAGSLNQNFTAVGPDNKGASFTFEFGDIPCNDSAIFYIYYGAGPSIAELKNAFSNVGASIYSIGYDKNYTTIAYGFGFKGVSGSAVAPTLPTKVASLPGGSSTGLDVYQTYAPPVIGDGTIYQALFRYQKDKQWIGEIKRYNIDSSGAIKSDPPLLASAGLLERAAVNGDYSSGGRSIWTVGYDPRCMSGSGFGNGDRNNFKLRNVTALEQLLYNCPATSNPAATADLINFTRGLNSYLEDVATAGAVRVSVLGDTYHSEMVMVGAPNAPWSSDVNMFGKSEAYFRSANGYSTFVANNANRRKQIYVGANDGMLHAFDADLNERWAFIPPPVVTLLRNMAGDKGKGDPNSAVGGGKSNSVFTVDGPITVKDVYFYGEGKWKTVLMGGLGWGGNAYYALDITDPDAPTHLFSFSNDVNNKSIDYWDASGQKSTFAYSANCSSFDYSKLGGSWSRPVIMLLPYDDGSNKQIWAAVFGGGYAGGASVTGAGTASTFGAYAYAVALEPNKSLTTSTCGANYPVGSTGGHVIAATPLSSDGSNIPNGVTAHLSVVTGDGTSLANYYGGIAYFTDLQGKLWKWNLSKTSLSDANSSLFSISQSFRTEADLSIDRMGFNQLGTTIVAGQDASGNKVNRLFNYFGTGDLTRIQRRASTINNRIYGISDPDFPSSGLKDTNQTVSSTNFTNVNSNTCTATKSWYADVWAKTGVNQGEDFQKIVGRASVFNKYVYFTAYQPDANECPIYGRSRVIEITDNCQTGGAGAVVGSGLATSPIIDNKGNIYVGISNLPPGTKIPSGRDNIAKLTSSASSSTGKIQYKSWREKRAY